MRPWYIRTYSDAISRWVNHRSACARHARGSRVPIFSAAAIISSSVAQIAPTSGVRISGKAPRFVTSTGVPENNASIVGNPNGSSHCAGIQRQRARASRTALRLPPTSPTYLMTPVKLAEEEIPLLLARAKDEIRRIESVVHERLAAVASRVIAGEKNRVRRQRRPRFPVAMQRLHERDGLGAFGAVGAVGAVGALLQRKVGVDDIGVVGKKGREVGGAVLQRASRDLDDARRRREFGTRLSQDGDAMPQGRQRLDQRHDDALGSAVTFDRKPVMGRDHDVHRRPSITTFAPWRLRPLRFCNLRIKVKAPVPPNPSLV